MRVLVVEDEFLIADYICDVLDEAGIEVLGVAASGEAALTLVDGGRPDLALVDVKLAGPMDGITLAESLRDRYAVSCIFVTGSGDPRTVARIEQTRLPRLQKPVRPESLVQAIRSAHPGATQSD